MGTRLLLLAPIAELRNTPGPTYASPAAEAYLRQSILNPDAYVVDGFPSGEMYQDYAQTLSKAEINNLLAYLAQLK